jgi:hypothetical protein
MLTPEQIQTAIDKGIAVPGPMRDPDRYAALPDDHPLKRDDHPAVVRIREAT